MADSSELDRQAAEADKLKAWREDQAKPLHVDKSRLHSSRHNDTGIYVRAYSGTAVGNYDISQLTKESLLRWLRSRGGSNPWAESCVLIMLGYMPDDSDNDPMAK